MKKSAEIQAKVTYYTPIGSFTTGSWRSLAERNKIMQRHIDILCGAKLIATKSDADWKVLQGSFQVDVSQK